jgi:hypothetical protein
MSRDTESATQIGMLAGDNWQVTCHAYKLTTPILCVTAGSATISVSIGRREDMPASGVAFARQLVRSAQRFAAECERLHALHNQASGEDDGQDPALQVDATSR